MRGTRAARVLRGSEGGEQSVFPRDNSLKFLSSMNWKPSTPETQNVPEQYRLRCFFF